MTPAWNWSAFFAAFPEANAALKANAPLPPAPDLTMADIGASLTSAEGDIAEAAALLAQYPGAVTAMDIILAAQGAWTAPMRSFLAALPGGVAAAQKYLPEIATAIAMFQAAPQPMGGGDSPHPGWGRG